MATLPDLIREEDCQLVLERLLSSASKSFIINGKSLKISISIGVSFYPRDGVDSDILLRHADQAMYVAKQAGKNRYHFFDSAQNKAAITRHENIGGIRAAFDRREYVLYYQPKVNIATGEVMGVEALIRWQHPVKGLIPPLEFLPIIENSDIALAIDEWVIDTGLAQITLWQRTGVDLSLSVNISAHLIQQDNFVERLSLLLAAHPEFPPGYLELEILETSALNSIDEVAASLNECKALGVRFSLDDFGTGYSSLTYLKRLPIHSIKIDQSFVRDMLEDPDDLTIISGVIGLAKSFGLEVIAEGVETIEHGTALLQMGCELAQGYGIAKPMPARDIPAWISEWKPDGAWQSK